MEVLPIPNQELAFGFGYVLVAFKSLAETQRRGEGSGEGVTGDELDLYNG